MSLLRKVAQRRLGRISLAQRFDHFRNIVAKRNANDYLRETRADLPMRIAPPAAPYSPSVCRR